MPMTHGGYVLGVSFKLASTFSGTLGKQFISLSAREGIRCRRAIFAVGMLMNCVLTAAFDALSCAYAPQVVVGPVGGLGVCWNLLCAPCLLGEVVTRLKVLAVLIVGSGSVIIAVVGPAMPDLDASSLRVLVLRPAVAFYVGGLLLWMVVGSLIASRREKGDLLRGFLLGSLAGSLAGCMIFLTIASRYIREAVEENDPILLWDWFPIVIIVAAILAAIGGLLIIAKGLQEFEAIFQGTIFEGAMIVSAAVSGAVCLKELEGSTWSSLCLYWACIAWILLGLQASCRAEMKSPPRSVSDVELLLRDSAPHTDPDG